MIMIGPRNLKIDSVKAEVIQSASVYCVIANADF